MKYNVGFIGVGNMGGALLRAVCKSVNPDSVAIYDVSKERLQQTAEMTGTNAVSLNELVSNSKYVFLGVKPNIIETVLSQIKSFISDETVLVSMAAGVSLSKIISCADTSRVIRIMPNTPCAVGKGMTLYCIGNSVSDSDVSDFEKILSESGELDRIDEKNIDAAAALSGCGPAFVYMFIEALTDGAVECGLPRDKAMFYAKQMVLGSASLAKNSDKHPGQLKDEVCSPGGTTIEGVLTLEKGAFRHTVSNAVISACNKTSKLIK